MDCPTERRSRRWMLRRLERQDRRRGKAMPRPPSRITAVASLVDGYHEFPGPALNDDLADFAGRRAPFLAVVRS